MNYKIIPTKEFEKGFHKLDKNFQVAIIKKINEIAKDPTRYKYMKYPWNKYCRIRIGKLRIIFRYDSEKQELYLNKIVFGHKY